MSKKNKKKTRIVVKSESKLMKFIGFLVYPFNKTFMTGYVTTIGRTIYTPNKNGKVNKLTLAHEEKHIEQYNKYGILYMLAYLFLLPTVFTMRSHYEKQAYAVDMGMYYKDNYRKANFKSKWKKYRNRVKLQFTSGAYLWMNPFKKSMDKWLDKVEADIKKKLKVK